MDKKKKKRHRDAAGGISPRKQRHPLNLSDWDVWWSFKFSQEKGFLGIAGASL